MPLARLSRDNRLPPYHLATVSIIPALRAAESHGRIASCGPVQRACSAWWRYPTWIKRYLGINVPVEEVLLQNFSTTIHRPVQPCDYELDSIIATAPLHTIHCSHTITCSTIATAPLLLRRLESIAYATTFLATVNQWNSWCVSAYYEGITLSYRPLQPLPNHTHIH
jgi:hypothetical protein